MLRAALLFATLAVAALSGCTEPYRGELPVEPPSGSARGHDGPEPPAQSDGPPPQTDGPTADGPTADGPTADGPAPQADGPAPQADGPARQEPDAGADTLVCPDGFHPCEGRCADNRAPATCGGACEACPTPANGTATCDGTSCGFTCDPSAYRCASACIPRTRSCNGACPSGLRACGASCVEGDCCPGDSCGPCRSCQNNRCQPTADNQGGPGCSGTCQECSGGRCRSKPDHKVCGSACVPDAQCCPACGGCTTCTAGSCQPVAGNCRSQTPADGEPVCQANGQCAFACRTSFVRSGNECDADVAGSWTHPDVPQGIQIVRSGRNITVRDLGDGRGDHRGTIAGRSLRVEFVNDPGCCTGVVDASVRTISWSNGSSWTR